MSTSTSISTSISTVATRFQADWTRRLAARPIRAWTISATLLALCVAVPGTMIGSLLGGPAKADGINGDELLGSGLCLLLVLLFAVPAWGLPKRWFGLTSWRSGIVVHAAVLAGLLPWLSPHGPGVFRLGDQPVWALAFVAAGLTVLPATGLLLVGGRRAWRAGAILLLVAAALWWPARQGLLAAQAGAALNDMGRPPRAQVQFVHWDGAGPSGTAYRDGALVVQYLPSWGSPDTPTFALVVAPIRGAGTDADLCDAAQRAARAGNEWAFGAAVDAGLSCGRSGPGTWRIGASALARREGNWAVVVMDDPSDPVDFHDLAATLATAQPADDAEMRVLDTGAITD